MGDIFFLDAEMKRPPISERLIYLNYQYLGYSATAH